MKEIVHLISVKTSHSYINGLLFAAVCLIRKVAIVFEIKSAPLSELTCSICHLRPPDG